MTRPVLLVALALFAGPGCASSHSGSDGGSGDTAAGAQGGDGAGNGSWQKYPAEPGRVPEAEQKPGDPQRGYDLLVNGDYLTCGLPAKTYLEMFPPAASDAIVGRSQANRGVPYHQTITTHPSGMQVVAFNCLSCHAGKLLGDVVVGLGDSAGDATRRFSDNAPLMRALFSRNEDELAVYDAWAERFLAMEEETLLNTVGLSSGQNLTASLMARLDPETLRWMGNAEGALGPIDTRLPGAIPLDVPPLWRMKKRHSMYYSSHGRQDHTAWMMQAAFSCLDGDSDVPRIQGMFQHIRAYLRSMPVPRYPWPVDTELASQGETVFGNRCAGCHGTYGSANHDSDTDTDTDTDGVGDGGSTGHSYPNLVVGLNVVKTDPLYAQAMHANDAMAQWVDRSPLGETAQYSPVLGYIAPPLDGIWATAPYLHNGSVPDLVTLLNSGKRPKFWRRTMTTDGTFDNNDYDPQTLGWRYQTLPAGKASEADDPEAQRFIYDTTQVGYSNAGHTFGDRLSDSDRTAVIEYLKTL